MSLKGWGKVWESFMPTRLSVAKALLEERGIPAVILNKQDSSYHWGKAELYVPVPDTILAKAILDEEFLENESNGLNDD